MVTRKDYYDLHHKPVSGTASVPFYSMEDVIDELIRSGRFHHRMAGRSEFIQLYISNSELSYRGITDERVLETLRTRVMPAYVEKGGWASFEVFTSHFQSAYVVNLFLHRDMRPWLVRYSRALFLTLFALFSLCWLIILNS